GFSGAVLRCRSSERARAKGPTTRDPPTARSRRMSGDLLGQVIDGKYKLVRLLGSGGMGAVYEGENLRIRRRVAIKMLHGEVSRQAETVTRFEREAQAAGRIGSEHICEVLDLGVLGDGTRYMVMEYLDGETLAARIKRFGRLAPAQSIPLFAQVL